MAPRALALLRAAFLAVLCFGRLVFADPDPDTHPPRSKPVLGAFFLQFSDGPDDGSVTSYNGMSEARGGLVVPCPKRLPPGRGRLL